jgi:hypothetical protein
MHSPIYLPFSVDRKTINHNFALVFGYLFGTGNGSCSMFSFCNLIFCILCTCNMTSKLSILQQLHGFVVIRLGCHLLTIVSSFVDFIILELRFIQLGGQ